MLTKPKHADVRSVRRSRCDVSTSADTRHLASSIQTWQSVAQKKTARHGDDRDGRENHPIQNSNDPTKDLEHRAQCPATVGQRESTDVRVREELPNYAKCSILLQRLRVYPEETRVSHAYTESCRRIRSSADERPVILPNVRR